MIVAVMGGPYEFAKHRRPQWEPEPLHLPVDAPPAPERSRREKSAESGRAGGHVFVIDIVGVPLDGDSD